ncbi:FecR family protein [Bacteroides sp.]|uniref:FecR family protein n=1 Tax=Bacteroides sp. TaxID=29523 RepID=UPI0025C23AD3|nr:FecR family protein [Bacteroides sp.]
MNQELLHKYFKGNTTVEEEKRILNWVDESENNRKTLLNERMLFDIALFTDSKRHKREKAVAGARLIPMLRWSARIAATVIVVLCCGYLLKEYQYNKVAQTQTVAVPAGQRAQITLADGTKVWLNAQSTLSYSSNFGRNDRNVELDGEAYFEVAKNKEIPFNVNTETNQVRVVGTHFNVCAYKGSDEFETTLIEGIVDIYAKGNDHPLARLKKNEFFGSYAGKNKKTVLPSYDYLRWREGLYCFDDSALECIFSKLEKYYNVKIIVDDPALLNYRCTGKFKEQDGIEHILKVIQKDLSFTYSINEERDTIWIK